MDVGAPVSRYDASTGWKQHAVYLTGRPGQSSVLVGLLGISDYGNDVHIDDVSVDVPAPLTPPAYLYLPAVLRN